MDTIVITLRHHQDEIDLELPISVPMFVLGPILVEKLKWSDLQPKDDSLQVTGRNLSSGNKVVSPHETLAQAGVSDGDVLELVLSQKIVHKELPLSQERGSYLECVATGKRFACRGQSMLVGRLRHLPINLTGLPGDDAVSRTHANLIIHRDGFWIKDERSTNGTMVDGVRLQPGERVLIRHGSQIQFGVDGPILIFHSGFTHAE